MQLSQPPSQRTFLISFIIGIGVLAASIIGFGLVDDLMILAIVGIYYAAAHYQRHIFRLSLALTVCLSLLVTWLTVPPDQVPSAALTTALFGLVTLISCEFIFQIRAAQRRTEHELMVQSERYRQITQLTSDYIFSTLIAPDGTPTNEWVTDTFLRLTGYTTEELRDPTLAARLFHPGDAAVVQAMLGNIIAGQTQRAEFRIVTRDGQVRWIRSLNYPESDETGRVVRMIGAGQDITDQRALEEQLRTQNLYLEMLHSAVLGLVDQHPQIDTLLQQLTTRAAALFDVNNAFLCLHDPAIDAMVLSVGVGESNPRIGLVLRRGEGIAGTVWETNAPLLIEDYATWDRRVVRVDISMLHASMGVPLRRDNQVVGVLGVNSTDPDRTLGHAELELLIRFGQVANALLANAHLFDRAQQELAARVQAEAELRRERQLFVDGPAVVFKWRIAPGYPVEYVSPNIRQFGYTPEQLTSGQLTFTALVHPDDRKRTGQEVLRHLAEGSPSFDQEYRLIRSDGAIRWVHDFSTFIVDESGHPGYIDGYLLDETERHLARQSQQELERQLREAQRLESLGLLAGGVAHDFNNLLAAIQGNTGLALLDLDHQHPAYQSLQQVQRATARAAGLTRQLLAYAGKGRVLVQAVNINALIEDMIALLQSSISKKIRVRTQLELNLPEIHADATQIQQVIMNLIVNAAEAIGDQDGTIAVRTTSQPGRNSQHAGGGPDPEATFVTLTIADSGSGMDPVTLGKIFDPFFTTKFTGRGLGLAAVRGIITSHQGHLVVESTVGVGSTFTIRLPASTLQAEGTPPGPATAAPAEPPAAALPNAALAAVILVIEDEAELRSLARRTLERIGMRVITAGDGLLGLEALSAEPAITCVLLDMTMPRMDGPQTLAAISQRSPHLPVVVMSGYSSEQIYERLSSANPVSFLAKPFDPTALERAIRQALQTDPSPSSYVS